MSRRPVASNARARDLAFEAVGREFQRGHTGIRTCPLFLPSLRYIHNAPSSGAGSEARDVHLRYTPRPERNIAVRCFFTSAAFSIRHFVSSTSGPSNSLAQIRCHADEDGSATRRKKYRKLQNKKQIVRLFLIITVSGRAIGARVFSARWGLRVGFDLLPRTCRACNFWPA